MTNEEKQANREKLGKAVRDAYVARCKLKADPHPKFDTPWEGMSEFDRETDRCIADAVVATATVDVDRILGLSIKDLVAKAHETAKAKGWWENPDRNVGEQIALMHSELSEALEEYRVGRPPLDAVWRADEDDPASKPEGFGIELADVLIRIADTCGRYGIDLEECVRVKLAYNLSRPHRHGGKKA